MVCAMPQPVISQAIHAQAARLAEREDQHELRLAMFEALAAGIRRGVAVPRPPPPAPRRAAAPLVSLVICSVDPDKWRAVTAMYGRVFAGRPHEIIGLHDARSLSEAYNRGIARARGELIVFSHDDVEFLAGDAADRLLAHLDRVDLVGVAGTSRVVGPSWIQGGWRTMRGQVATPGPAGAGLRVDVYGVDGPLTTGIQALDGLFLACRRAVAETVRFDAETFDGFHLYDTDFSLRAFQSGWRLGVANDMPVLHLSRGRLGEAWRTYANRFLAKFRDPSFHGTFGDNPLRAVVLDDRDQVRRFCDAILALAAEAPPGALAPAPEPPALLGLLPPGLGRVARMGGEAPLGTLYRRAHPACDWSDLAPGAEPEGRVDALVYDDVLGELERPLAILHRDLAHLGGDGVVLASLPNPQHLAVIEGLLRGRPEPVRLFTLDHALALLGRAGLKRFEVASCVRGTQNGAPLLGALAPALEAAGVARDAFAARAAAHHFVIRATFGTEPP